MSRQVSKLASAHERAKKHANKQTKKREATQHHTTRKDTVSRPDPIAKPDTDEQLQAAGKGFTKWQTVIWREWCRCKDEDYGYYLFDLVKDTAFGRNFVVLAAMLGVVLGALAGYLLGSMIDASGINFGAWDLSGLPPVILAWTMGLAGGTIGVEGSRRFRALYFWWQGQPPVKKVEWALRQAQTHHPPAKQVWDEPLRLLDEVRKKQLDPNQLIAKLESDDWKERFAAGHALIAIGGEATETLQELATDQTNPLWETVVWLLASIERDTTNQFAWRVNHTLCPHCLVRYDARSVDVALGVSFTYYGCRVCGQSRDFLDLPRGTVAVLDNMWPDEQNKQDDLLQVNWLVRRTLFDFDWIEIINATDEDVERFAIQVGNDTDPFRRDRYSQMHCILSRNCRLSENTMRILQRMFGQMKQR